MYNAVAKN